MPHATHVGPGLAAAVGIACLVAGTYLLATGTVTLVRRLPGWWRLLAVPAAGVTAALVVFPLTFAVLVTHTPGTALEDGRPSDFGLAYRNVAFTTDDGIELSGWYLPSSNGAAVVLMHGSGSTRSRVLDHAIVLAEHGYGVLLYDSRGNGESQGRAMGLGWYGDLDTAAAVSFLAHQPDVHGDRIGAVGMSMGGEQAIGAAGSDDRILAVVAEGATGRTRQDNAWADRGVGSWLTRAGDLVAFTATDLLTPASPPPTLRSSVASAAPRPVLLIAGAGELSATRHIEAGAPGSVELWELPNTAHTNGLSEHPAEWERRVVDFLDHALEAS